MLREFLKTELNNSSGIVQRLAGCVWEAEVTVCHANAMVVVGNGVRGGKVYGQWPGLRSDQLYEGRDLALTTDFRDVFGEIASRHLGNSNLKDVFPGYSLSQSKFRGFLNS